MNKEGLPFIRIMFMLSCLAPLFILMMIRGINMDLCYDNTLKLICTCFIVVPLFFVLLRIIIAKQQNDKLQIEIKEVTQNKEYVFTYFFTVLLPLYGIALTNNRELYAYLTAIILIFLILFRLNLYYTNIFFILFKYNVYVIKPNNYIILSKKELTPNSIIVPYRLSNSVYIIL